MAGQPQARPAADARGQPAVPQGQAIRAGDHRLAPRLAGRAQSGAELDPDGIDQLWVADITYVHLAEEFAFLAIVLDAFSRRVVGWALETHLCASLAIAALDMALEARRPPPDSLIHHSDRGVQYACKDYAQRLATHRIQASMSRVGNPYDNAKAERFMRTLKQEEADGRAYRDAAEAREKIGTFIEAVYNRQRLHSALGYCPPVEYEEFLAQRAQAHAPEHAASTTCP